MTPSHHNPAAIYLEGVTLESLREPEGERRADEIFARNERILFPLLMPGRNQVDESTAISPQPSSCDTSRTLPRAHV